MDARSHPARLFLWPSPEQALLLDAVLGADEQAIEAFEAWCARVDLDQPIDWGVYRLLPLAYDRLRDLGADNPLMTRLKGVYRRAWAETQTLFNDVAMLIAALEAKGVPTLMTKGAPLAVGYYRTPAARPMRDVDFAVRRRDLDRAVDVAKAEGWTPAIDLTDDAVLYRHSLTVRSAAGRDADLHWHCLFETVDEAADDWFWRGARPFDFNGVLTRQPAPEALLPQVILHGLRVNADPPLRWITDSVAIIRKGRDTLDWEALVAFAREHRVTHRLWLGLHRVAERHGAAAPTAVLDALRSHPRSLVERLENSACLDPVRGATRLGRRWAHVADYSRFVRVRSPLAALWGGLDYIRATWRLPRRRDVPSELLRRVGRAYWRPDGKGASA